MMFKANKVVFECKETSEFFFSTPLNRVTKALFIKRIHALRSALSLFETELNTLAGVK